MWSQAVGERITLFCKFSVTTLWAALQVLGSMAPFVQNTSPVDLGADCSVSKNKTEKKPK